MKKKKLIIFLVVLLTISSALSAYFLIDDTPINPDAKLPSGSGNPAPLPYNITYENLASYLATTSFAKAVPEDVQLSLEFYNFDSGSREIEKTFVIEKANVYEGNAEDPILTIFIASSYLDELNSQNLCSVMSKAKSNGDLGYEYTVSEVELAWKLKSLNDYKSCFGF